MRALIISADQFEDMELMVPYYRLLEEGWPVEVASCKRGVITGKHGYEVRVNKAFSEIDSSEYDLLVIPGGQAPATVRRDQAALEICRHFFAAGKPVGAICHGPQVLISADLAQGLHATCYMRVADELRAAGGNYEDREVVVDGNLVTSRQPADLPAFTRELMRLARG